MTISIPMGFAIVLHIVSFGWLFYLWRRKQNLDYWSNRAYAEKITGDYRTSLFACGLLSGTDFALFLIAVLG